jgi:multiple antibiotic resistance protein
MHYSSFRENIVLFLNSFLLAFSALLPLVNPPGSALVFLGLVGTAPATVYRALARRIAVNTIIFLTVIEILGSAILRFFGISLPIVQLAGGIVIASMGWSLLNENDAQANSRNKQEELATDLEVNTKDLEQKAFYPFTFPVTAGPGTLVVMLTLSAHATHPLLTDNVLGHLGILLSSIILSVMVYFCYAYAPRLTAAIAPGTVHGILRVIAFILLCIGVQIAWKGLAVLLASVVHP